MKKVATMTMLALLASSQILMAFGGQNANLERLNRVAETVRRLEAEIVDITKAHGAQMAKLTAEERTANMSKLRCDGTTADLREAFDKAKVDLSLEAKTKLREATIKHVRAVFNHNPFEPLRLEVCEESIESFLLKACELLGQLRAMEDLLGALIEQDANIVKALNDSIASVTIWLATLQDSEKEECRLSTLANLCFENNMRDFILNEQIPLLINTRTKIEIRRRELEKDIIEFAVIRLWVVARKKSTTEVSMIEDQAYASLIQHLEEMK